LKQSAAHLLSMRIKHEVADIAGIPVSEMPKVFVSIPPREHGNDWRLRIVRVKQGVHALAFTGTFAANAHFSGGRLGVGIGRLTSHGYGVVEVRHGIV